MSNTAAELMKDTDINPADLDEEMRRQSGLFSHYAAVCAKAQLTMDNRKLKRDVTVAKIAHEIRDMAAEDGGKYLGVKLTEKTVEGAINLDVRWVQAQKDYNQSKSDFELFKGALEALKQKRDMLIQLGVNAREEYKGEMRIKEIAAKDEATGSARDRAVAIAGNKSAA
jgi:uncharacterized protein YggU (UPF0235/DUF167 family)